MSPRRSAPAPDLPAIAHRRLHHQRIGHPAPASALETVRALGALQAQDYVQAVWALGSRIPGSTLASIEAAIAKGEILRTWPMRGTVHFVPAADAAWMVALSAQRTIGQVVGRIEGLGLTLKKLDRCNDIFRKGM
ncbi:MAG: crosslink repair DNA glycosylase YcaQ family protein, partial [Gemmatimonadota bacterium]